jgi:hypothetical protein
VDIDRRLPRPVSASFLNRSHDFDWHAIDRQPAEVRSDSLARLEGHRLGHVVLEPPFDLVGPGLGRLYVDVVRLDRDSLKGKAGAARERPIYRRVAERLAQPVDHIAEQGVELRRAGIFHCGGLLRQIGQFGWR